MIKEKMWSLGNDFKIADENGEDAFFVKGKVFSWGDDLSLLDTAGVEQARIKQKLMSFLPCYEIIRNGELFARVIKEFTWFNKEFTLDVPGPNDYSIKGSFWLHNYQFSRSGNVVATVTKNLWSWTDTLKHPISQRRRSQIGFCITRSETLWFCLLKPS